MPLYTNSGTGPAERVFDGGERANDKEKRYGENGMRKYR